MATIFRIHPLLSSDLESYIFSYLILSEVKNLLSVAKSWKGVIWYVSALCNCGIDIPVFSCCSFREMFHFMQPKSFLFMYPRLRNLKRFKYTMRKGDTPIIKQAVTMMYIEILSPVLLSGINFASVQKLRIGGWKTTRDLDIIQQYALQLQELILDQNDLNAEPNLNIYVFRHLQLIKCKVQNLFAHGTLMFFTPNLQEFTSYYNENCKITLLSSQKLHTIKLLHGTQIKSYSLQITDYFQTATRCLKVQGCTGNINCEFISTAVVDIRSYCDCFIQLPDLQTLILHSCWYATMDGATYVKVIDRLVSCGEFFTTVHTIGFLISEDSYYKQRWLPEKTYFLRLVKVFLKKLAKNVLLFPKLHTIVLNYDYNDHEAIYKQHTPPNINIAFTKDYNTLSLS